MELTQGVGIMIEKNLIIKDYLTSKQVPVGIMVNSKHRTRIYAMKDYIYDKHPTNYHYSKLHHYC